MSTTHYRLTYLSGESGSGSEKDSGEGESGADHPDLSSPCPICLLPIDRPAFTSCGHIFCFACLNTLVTAATTHPRCPLCRKNL